MANLKEVRNRIVSVNSTQQITSAMKMVSASKLRRAQNAIVQMRPYANKLKEILENLSAGLDSSEGIYSKKCDAKNVLLVIITSNRGLAGAFNANVIKKAHLSVKTEYKNSNVSVVCIGKKGVDFFKKNNYVIVSTHNELYEELTFTNVAPVVEKIMKAFVDKEFDKIEIVYNQFKNAAVQNVVKEQFLPVLPPKKENLGDKKVTVDYIFEPTKEEIVQDLIPRSLKTQFYKALLDSHASEHGARMTSMHKATDNAKELIKELKLSYNKARQAAITGEILEIVGGAEALSG